MIPKWKMDLVYNLFWNTYDGKTFSHLLGLDSEKTFVLDDFLVSRKIWLQEHKVSVNYGNVEKIATLRN